jgi:signal peptidase II
MPLNDTVPLWLGVFHITHTRNIGAAFSLLEGKTWLLIGSALVVIAVIVGVAQRHEPARMPLSYALALGLPLGGAVGNLIDRLRLGYVTDLFDFTLINFPVFNVADSAITVGIVILLWRTLFVTDGAGRIIATTEAPSTNAPISGS